MDKLYIFAIGGTGARVLKSLTMLLAAGVKINAKEIVPIIIDPDAGAGNKTEVIGLMDLYDRIYSKIDHNDDDAEFFKTRISKIFHNYAMPLGGNTSFPFETYMNLNSLSDEDRALVNLLYSAENQNTDMTIGFTGNPNIGATVLNDFINSKEFEDFANGFNANDGIFVVSSIFGGTGASGFPLLVKNLRHISSIPGIAATATIQEAPIGAITVLPYFNLKPGGDIDANTFMSKTKSALSYYAENLKEVNFLYYIGDTMTESFANNKGGMAQKNAAHFVELASALAVVDFARNADGMTNASTVATVYKEFGVKDDVDSIKTENLETNTRALIDHPMADFTLFSKYVKEELNDAINTEQVWITDGLDYRVSVLNGQFRNDLDSFVDQYLNWLEEMAKNKRSFNPYVIEENRNNVFGFIRGIKTKSIFDTRSNYSLYNHRLNKVNKAKIEQNNPEGRFIAHMNKATKKLREDKINI